MNTNGIQITIQNLHNVEIPAYVVERMERIALFQGRKTFVIDIVQPELKTRWDNLIGTGILVSQFHVNGRNELFTAKTTY